MCAICLQRMHQQRESLPCMHTFCAHCMDGARLAGHTRCPICRTPIGRPPASGVDAGMPVWTNHALRQMLRDRRLPTYGNKSVLYQRIIAATAPDIAIMTREQLVQQLHDADQPVSGTDKCGLAQRLFLWKVAWGAIEMV